jgi:hypothetical protein
MALVHLVAGLVVGAVLLGAGYLLRFQHAVAVVPFFNPASFDDPRRTAERLGLVAFVLGALAIAAGVYLFV